MYEGGRLKSAGYTKQQAMDPFLSTKAAAAEFAQYAKKGYKGAQLAVNAQRPADFAGYQKKINAAMSQANQLLAGGGGASDSYLNAPVEGAAVTPQTSGAQSQQDIILNALMNRRQSGGTAKALRAAMVAAKNEEQPDDPTPVTAPPNEGSVFGSAGKTNPNTAAGVEQWAKQQVGKPYVWGGGHGKKGEYAGMDCSGFVSQVLMRVAPNKYKSSGTTMTLFPKMKGRAASPDAPIAIGYRGMDSNSPRSQHMGIRINGTWYSAGGRGNNKIVVGDSNWDHVVLP